MDKEFRFISALLRASKNEQEEFYQKLVPQAVFLERPLEISWVYKFREKFGHFPSPKAFQHKFSEKLVFPKDSLPACLQPVLDASMFAQMSTLTTKVKTAIDSGEDMAKAMQMFKSGVNALTSFSIDYVDTDFATSKGALVQYKEVAKLLSTEGTAVINSPWATQNKLIPYMLPGEVVAFAARTSIGKTWLTLDWAHHLSSKGVSVLYITKEMSTDSIRNRLECRHYQLPYSSFRSSVLSPKDLGRWRRLRSKGNAPSLLISGEETVEGVGLAHVVSKIQQYKPQVVFVDGAYLIHPEGLSPRASSVERLSYLSNRFKAIAKALKVVIVVVLQLNRSAENSKEAGGSLNQIYGADAWAQDSDYVIVATGRRGSDRRIMKVEKGRESALGEFTVKFTLDPPNFREVAGGFGTTDGPPPFTQVK